VKGLKILIVGIWIITMALLLKKEGFLESAHNLTYYDILGKKDPYREEYLGLYIGKQRIGFSKSYIDAYSFSDDKIGFRISNETRVFIRAFDILSPIHISTEILVDDRYKLSSFIFSLSTEQYKIKAKGERKNNKIITSLYSGESLIAKKEFKEKGFILGQGLFPLTAMPPLSEGRCYSLEGFDPFGIMGKERITLQIKKRTTIMHNDELFEVYPIILAYHGIKANIYATRDGKILRAYFPYGWMAKQEDERKASKIKFSYPDITDIASYPSNILIKEPRGVKWLKVKIDNEIKVIRMEAFPKNPYFLPIKEYLEYKEATPFIQAGDKRIIEKAKEITKGEKNSLKASILLMRWVYNNISQKPVFSIPSAIEVLEKKEGDCNEHTILFTALARSIGIPTKVITGLCYCDGRFYYHAWCLVFCGTWLSLDPTFNQIPVDATHIPLVEGDIGSQISQLGYIGNIKIEVLKYGYN